MQDFVLKKGIPTLIYPLVSGRILKLSPDISRSPWLVVCSEDKEVTFASEFSELIVLEFHDPALSEAVADNQKTLPGFSWPREFSVELTQTDWMKAIVKRYFFERVQCASSQVNCTYFLEKQILNEVINIAFRAYDSRQYAIPRAARPSDGTSDVIKWIGFLRQNIHRTVTAREIESFAGLSISEVSRVFKRELNVTPLAFHKKSRLEEAKRLIDLGHLSVNQAAVAFGYSDGVSFRHAFKREFGISPAKRG